MLIISNHSLDMMTKQRTSSWPSFKMSSVSRVRYIFPFNDRKMCLEILYAGPLCHALHLSPTDQSPQVSHLLHLNLVGNDENQVWAAIIVQWKDGDENLVNWDLDFKGQRILNVFSFLVQYCKYSWIEMQIICKVGAVLPAFPIKATGTLTNSVI